MEKSFKGFIFWWLESENNPRNIIVSMFVNLIIIISIILTMYELFYDSPNLIVRINFFLLIFFILEYSLRFYVGTDFIDDVKKQGTKIAFLNKIKWMFSFYHLIDLLAILPIIRFLRIFRTFRLFRFLRTLRLLRIFKFFHSFNRAIIFLRGLRSGLRFIIILIVVTIFTITILSLFLFIFEKNNINDFGSIQKSLWFSVKLTGYGKETPHTIVGRIIVALIILSNVAFFSLLVSIFTAKIREIMENIKKGKLGNLNMEGHIVLCGYTRSTQVVIDELLKNKRFYNRIVVITNEEEVDIGGVLYLKGDFSEIKNLRNANIAKASMAVVFSEPLANDEDKKMTDLRTVMTVFNIEKENDKVHTIAEINFDENAKIIKEKIFGDEIIYKESIDANIIANSIRHNYISPMIYEMLNLEGKVFKEKLFRDFGFDKETKYFNLKESLLQKNITLLGFINKEDDNDNQQKHKCNLAPDNNQIIKPDDRVIYLE